MPRVIAVDDQGAIGIDECVDLLGTGGFDAEDADSIDHAASALKRLGNNPDFLGDILIDELKSGWRDTGAGKSYSSQSILLARPSPHYYLRANIWPSCDEYAFRASGESPFFFGLPHDHNFDFLTVGYFGPGYWSDYYEYDFNSVAGYRGEPVELKFVERSRLESGKVLHYRAHRDVHVQHPADSLSVSLNIMKVPDHGGWRDQYRFDIEKREVAGILSHSAHEVLLRLVLGMDEDNGRDIAEDFTGRHSSERIRLSAWAALASHCSSDSELADHLAKGCAHISPRIRGEARRMLARSEGVP